MATALKAHSLVLIWLWRCYGLAMAGDHTMPPDRTALARMGKLVMADVAAGRPGLNSEAVSRALEARPRDRA